MIIMFNNPNYDGLLIFGTVLFVLSVVFIILGTKDKE